MPKKLVWNSGYSVGNETLDNQHKKLMGLCNKLAISDGQSDAQFHEILDELSAYARVHFATEEALLLACGYPLLGTQQEDHAEYEKQVVETLAAASNGTLDKVELQRLLSSWWNDHILISDRDYRGHVMAFSPGETKPAEKPALKFSTGEKVLALRKKTGLTQTPFWSRIGLTQSAGSRYESGRNIPRPVQHLLQLVYGTDKQSAELLTWLRYLGKS